ncbi:32685_t:CDS:1 [Racocetra persica]|uniref:32685_t:CDS:1 n=1 Tax=Racocetra persica TaxID=160502 RepID=A0ACA9PUS9_9GLOM|nr:32685_t:CDS:1 [Racocetra persica]
MNRLFIIILIVYTLALIIDARKFESHHSKAHHFKAYPDNKFKTCTLTETSTNTITSIISCESSTPLPSAICPQNSDYNDDCNGCEKTTTVTCTPTTTVCLPTCTPDGDPCDLGNPGACCSLTCCNFDPPAQPTCCL